jgi:fido (protein-threonine AMPylation protein)
LAFYVNDVWLGELGTTPGVSVSATVNLVEHVSQHGFEAFKASLADKASDPARLWTKVVNLHVVVQALFNPEELHPIHEAYQKRVRDICTALAPLDFSPALAQELHRHLLQDVDEQPGELRCVELRPNNSNMAYSLSKDVPKRLAELFRVIKEMLPAGCDLAQALKVGGFFFRAFLLIHPFRNGNGRVARLLLSHLLRLHCVVPISLFLRNRAEYIDVLERCAPGDTPWACVAYIVRCAERQASNVYYLSL